LRQPERAHGGVRRRGLDHASTVGFGTDENLSMPGDEGVGPRELSVQWTVIAWGLQRNNHSAGSLLTISDTTIHHSFYAFNGTRNPKARSEQGRVLDFVTNVIYCWNAPDPVVEAMGWSISKQAFLLADSGNGTHNANAVGNYFIAHGKNAASQAFSSGTTDANGVPTFQLFFRRQSARRQRQRHARCLEGRLEHGRNGDAARSALGYTNLEEYLNELPAPAFPN
jgi:hypothetical protein